MARSRLVACDDLLTQAVVNAAVEYSKVMYLGVYSNQKASLWFSQLVKSILTSMQENTDTSHTAVLQGTRIDLDEVAGRRLAVRQLAQLFASASQMWEKDRRENIWSQAFLLCCNSSHPEVLLEELLGNVDECGWHVLEQHELIKSYSMQLLTKLPLTLALELWKRLEYVRVAVANVVSCSAYLHVLHLLQEKGEEGSDGGRIRQVVRAVLSTETLARQMLTDIARLVFDTRDLRVVDLWKRICRANIDVAAALDGQASRKELLGLNNCFVARKWPTIGGAQVAGRFLDLCVVFGCASGNVVSLFAQTKQPEAHFGQWRVAMEARRQQETGDGCIRIWLGAMVASDDNLAFDILDAHFGADSDASFTKEGLTPQQVVWREMALDVAAFAWAPLAGGSARAVAAAKDSVLNAWRRRSKR
ncbi:hypothetical protein GGI26_004693 [Coemansia sp. RSA 1358]|nr:hypothetical protein BX070DRAFT_234944 [Coemansia spiralis]KAJ2620797.1 hypothetical protein GGI26_004693 [Coemansia sp. RSA 1358]